MLLCELDGVLSFLCLLVPAAVLNGEEVLVYVVEGVAPDDQADRVETFLKLGLVPLGTLTYPC